MWRYEVLYRENGILKSKGFGYRDKFERCVARLSKKKNVIVLKLFDGDTGETTKVNDDMTWEEIKKACGIMKGV